MRDYILVVMSYQHSCVDLIAHADHDTFWSNVKKTKKKTKHNCVLLYCFHALGTLCKISLFFFQD